MAGDAMQLLEAARADLAKGYTVRAGTRFRQAADTGDPRALLELAECILEARIPGTSEEVRKRLEAVNRPSAELARLRSGLRHAGTGGAMDKAGSLSDLNASAQEGDPLSALELAALYHETGTEQALQAARAWEAFAKALPGGRGTAISLSPDPGAGTAMAHTDSPPPPLDEWPSVLHTTQGKRVLSDDPLIYSLSRLLTPLECAWLCEAARPHLAVSKIYDPATGTMRRDPTRTSDAMYFHPGNSSPLVLRTMDKILAHAGINPQYAEPLAILRYRPGQEYKPHYDWLNEASLMRDPLRQAGQRIATVLVYLNDPVSGGHTVFPRLGLDVSPRQGDLLYFSNIDSRGQPSRETLHAGAPVTEGEKWISSLWIREGRITP